MFVTIGQRILLGVFILIILVIPVGAYFYSQRQQAEQLLEKPDRTITSKVPKPTEGAASELKRLSTPSATPRSSEAPLTSPVSFGPTLTLKITLEGRPKDDQSVRLFVGLAAGNPTNNPKYLLSFTIDVPKDGIFSGLSLAGLDVGTTYTAYLKGPQHIATASAFVMAASTTTLNKGNPLILLAGDLNEDNVINSADFSIAKNAFGTSSKDAGFNQNVDFNKDGQINNLDTSFIIKNFGKTGNSGIWVSTPATSSGTTLLQDSPSTPSGHPAGGSGYWIWIPN